MWASHRLGHLSVPLKHKEEMFMKSSLIPHPGLLQTYTAEHSLFFFFLIKTKYTLINHLHAHWSIFIGWWLCSIGLLAESIQKSHVNRGMFTERVYHIMVPIPDKTELFKDCRLV